MKARPGGLERGHGRRARPAVEQRQFAHDGPGPQHGEKLFVAIIADDGDLQRAFENGVATVPGIACLEEDRPRLHRHGTCQGGKTRRQLAVESLHGETVLEKGFQLEHLPCAPLPMMTARRAGDPAPACRSHPCHVRPRPWRKASSPARHCHNPAPDLPRSECRHRGCVLSCETSILYQDRRGGTAFGRVHLHNRQAWSSPSCDNRHFMGTKPTPYCCSRDGAPDPPPHLHETPAPVPRGEPGFAFSGACAPAQWRKMSFSTISSENA